MGTQISTAWGTAGGCSAEMELGEIKPRNGETEICLTGRRKWIIGAWRLKDGLLKSYFKMQMLPLLFPFCILKYFSIRAEASREDKPASGQLRGDTEEYSKHVCQKGKPHQSLFSTWTVCCSKNYLRLLSMKNRDGGKGWFFFSMNFSYVHIFAMLLKKGYFHWLFGSTRNKKYGFKEWTAQTWVLITALNPIGTEWLSSRALGAVMTAGSECPNPALMLWPQMKISPNDPNLLPHALTHRQPVPHIHTKGLCQLCHGAK